VALPVASGQNRAAAATAPPEAAWPTWRTRLVLAALLLLPAGFYGGWVDAYLAHHVYSDTTATAVVCRDGARCSPTPFLEPWVPMRARLPPEPRLFVAHFDAICRPGDRLAVYPRRVRLRFGRHTEPLRRACDTWWP
jgi:hypothetical protein